MGVHSGENSDPGVRIGGSGVAVGTRTRPSTAGEQASGPGLWPPLTCSSPYLEDGKRIQGAQYFQQSWTSTYSVRIPPRLDADTDTDIALAEPGPVDKHSDSRRRHWQVGGIQRSGRKVEGIAARTEWPKHGGQRYRGKSNMSARIFRILTNRNHKPDL